MLYYFGGIFFGYKVFGKIPSAYPLIVIMVLPLLIVIGLHFWGGKNLKRGTWGDRVLFHRIKNHTRNVDFVAPDVVRHIEEHQNKPSVESDTFRRDQNDNGMRKP